MDENARKELFERIKASITGPAGEELTPKEYALVGVLLEFFNQHIELHRRVCRIEQGRR